MKILSISPFHDSTVCLLNNGKIEEFYKEERLTGKKRDGLPFKSIEKICEKHHDIDVALICAPNQNDIGLNVIKTYLKKVHNIKKIEDVSNEHHLQHASLAFYNSGFEKSLVFVIDRNGSYIGNNFREAESIFIAEYPDTFTPIYKNYTIENLNLYQETISDVNEKFKDCQLPIEIDVCTTHGITKVYESATILIGQHPLENGKTMGLASYGKENNNFKNLFSKDNIGNLKIFNYDENHNSVNELINDKKINELTSNNYKFYADYAYEVQSQTQQSTLKLLKKYIEKTNITNVCITGGYGLNVVTNSFLKENLPNINFYFEPLADDSGNSIGGAFLYQKMIDKNCEIKKIKTTFFHGENYSLSNVIGKKITIDEVSNKIMDNKIVAIYYKNAESGPRALGHRSILFDARNKNAKEIVNFVKKREWYRPFAGIMLKEDAEKYFYIKDFFNTKFMTINCHAKDCAIKEIPGILHVDNTCRIQIVDDMSEPVYKLLKNYKEKTGIGVLLNTSFNLAGKPLVETPEDAIWTLNNSKIDYIWFPEKQILV